MSFALGASLETLRRRAGILAAIRRFFAARGVLEVETPALSTAGVSDLNIESITARAASLGRNGGTLYLHTSPEYAMKRLLAAGSGDLYQMCRVFRDDELGRWHEPEFTMLEWYRVGFTEAELMDEVAALFAEILPTRAAPVRMRYADAYREALGCDAERDASAVIAERIQAAGIDVPPELPRAALLDLGFAAAVTPRFDAGAITFVHDFPPSQAALARIKPGPPPVAARFEAFYAGLELANISATRTSRAWDGTLTRLSTWAIGATPWPRCAPCRKRNNSASAATTGCPGRQPSRSLRRTSRRRS
jgi:lysyl-tRNA synthetase class 2